MTRALMIQGTGSNVGKSVLVAGLARAAVRRGLSVAPFKPQNMSNNAAVAPGGGEIGRAQALQALACGLAPHTDMNPVLLKPETETGAQVIVQGVRRASVRASDYAALKPSLMAPVLESFGRLKAAHELVLVEGAGSPAEVNLRAGDIANMGFARASGTPVVLAGDIDRGGVIAQVVGTRAVIEEGDAAMVAGFLINRFRGDPSLFDEGYAEIERRTGWRGFGTLPWFEDAWRLPAEDALGVADGRHAGPVHVACLALSRMANFDDLDPLSHEPAVRLTMVRAGQAVPGDADVVVLPGSKSTRGDLAFLRAQGWDVDLAAHVRRGGRVLGLCGGYQMLGEAVADPDGVEGPPGEDAGLGLLPVRTVMAREKVTVETQAVHAASARPIRGYEIHMGRTERAEGTAPFAHVGGRPEGAVSADGRIAGTYLHGLFRDDAFRAGWLEGLGARSETGYDAAVEETLDALAAHMEAHLDVEGMLAAAR